MNPAQQALMKLQSSGPTPSGPPPSYTNPTTGPLPAGEVGHNGPMVNPVQQAYEMLSQKNATTNAPSASDSGQQESDKGSVDYGQLTKKGYTPTQIEGYLSQNPGVTLKNAPTDWAKDIQQKGIIPKSAPLTETFGQIQPGVEVFSHGVTTGTGIGVKAGTPLATPPGKWKVVESYDNAPKKGYIGNGAGQGWGNNVLIQNMDTGEQLRYSHLSDVGVAQGDTIGGNRVLGLSGQSGNTTGDHLNLQYITPDGKPADVLKSQYAAYLPISTK